MKKKALKSNRNRHTGRVNDYKQRILDRGKLSHDSEGRAYCSIQSGVRSSMPVHELINYPGDVKVTVCSTVRDPRFDKAA